MRDSFFCLSPMILHLLAAPTSLHLGKESKLSLHSTFGTPVEKYVKEVQWTSDSVSGEYNANFFKGNHRNVVLFFLFCKTNLFFDVL